MSYSCQFLQAKGLEKRRSMAYLQLVSHRKIILGWGWFQSWEPWVRPSRKCVTKSSDEQFSKKSQAKSCSTKIRVKQQVTQLLALKELVFKLNPSVCVQLGIRKWSLIVWIHSFQISHLDTYTRELISWNFNFMENSTSLLYNFLPDWGNKQTKGGK